MKKIKKLAIVLYLATLQCHKIQDLIYNNLKAIQNVRIHTKII